MIDSFIPIMYLGMSGSPEPRISLYPEVTSTVCILYINLDMNDTNKFSIPGSECPRICYDFLLINPILRDC